MKEFCPYCENSKCYTCGVCHECPWPTNRCGIRLWEALARRWGTFFDEMNNVICFDDEQGAGVA